MLPPIAPRCLAPDFYVLGTPQVPVYLVGQGLSWTLIEGGLAWMADLVRWQLLQVVPELACVRHWFITHSHYDHCGLLTTLYAQLPRVQVYASAATARVFQQEKSRRVIERLNQAVTQCPGLAPAAAALCLSRVPITPLHEGAGVALGGHQHLQVLATPGHSACHISLWDVAHHRLFASDALGEFQESGEWCPLVFDDAPAYVASIRRIETLGATTLALAHHQVLQGRAAVQAPRRSLRSLYCLCRWLARRRAQGAGAPELAAALTAQFGGLSAGFLPAGLHHSSMLRLLQVLEQGAFLSEPQTV
ncbi:MBL fold metallo-hydrolase [Hymenobacter rubripertinctus]|uniref:MBL fold metallo-hydrolase n=1 Tax=Hymenobacter rubripertinctus TaxID=2029981 RepID=A0A418QWI1_9BACT|nr:MBL fold metallo-hydrolase [Hymenobacter rubripertinctus]RIY09572.1 MBL fold metallo-hydrolase [Hymenobacter rubripertinctus]